MDKQAKGTAWETIIRPRRGWFDIDLKDLFRYRDLILLMVKRNFTVLYKQTILGPAWVVVQPLLTTFVFTIVFGAIAGLPTDGIPKPLFYLGGSVCWNYFSNCLVNTSNTFVRNSDLFGKVYFPRLCVPISVVVTELINFAVQFLLFLILIGAYSLHRGHWVVHPNWQLMALVPLLLIQLGVLGLGCGIIVSAMTTRYRDLAMLVSFGVHLWMYYSPITYSTSLVMERYPHMMGVYMINPITPIIELFRAAFLGTKVYSYGYNLQSVCFTVIVLVLGVVLFSRVEKTFMDTV
ncbi:MAG: ABC transporter permease [Clostridia bacterium]|nr:ABC transporter permease [Clostridia bacterium]